MPFMPFASMALTPATNLVVWIKDGTKVAYVLNENPQITFTETDLIITASGIEVKYALENMARLTYEKSEETGIIDLNTHESSFNFNGEYLLFPSLKANSTVSIYDLNGTLNFKKRVSKAGEYAFSLSELKAGIYIVNVNGLIHKILKK